MNGMHLIDEELAELYYEATSPELEPQRRHLETCDECRERYDELAGALDLAKRLAIPELHPETKVETFERAWHASGRAERGWLVPRGGLVWALLRHSLSFGVGLAVGVALLASIPASPSKAIPSEEASMRSPAQQANRTDMRAGTGIEKVYSKLENPVIVVLEKESQPDRTKRIVRGTVEDGSIQVVWNL